MAVAVERGGAAASHFLGSWPGLRSVVVVVEAAISRLRRAGPRTFFDGANCGP